MTDPLLTEPETVARGRADAVDRTTRGQRRINLIWEVTQAVVAVSVTFTTLFVAARLSLDADDAARLLLSNAFFLVVGFYFGRTNHQRIGGIGPSEGVR